MSHEEWELHQKLEHTMRLIEYINDNIMDKDYKTGEFIHDALVELGKHISQDLNRMHAE